MKEVSKRAERIATLQSNYIKTGRGQGKGINYQPFIQAHDNKVASLGWLTRHKGWKTQRVHHTLSEPERKYLYFCEWLDGVIDIREQWPLLPIERTIEIANQLGIKHAHVDGTPVVMTTDLRLTLEMKAGETDVIRTIKPKDRLDERTLELFEIERIYFEEAGVDWSIVTEEKIPQILVKNVEWLAGAKYLDTRPGMDAEFVYLMSEYLLEEVLKDAGQTPIKTICLKTDKTHSLQGGTCMFVLQHMLATKRWSTDMESRIIRDRDPLIIVSHEIQKDNTIHFA